MYKTLRMRVGTEGIGRRPVWAEFPLMLHRPLPADAVVKGAWVRRFKVADRFRWELQIQLESTTVARVEAAGDKRGVVAIDLLSGPQT